MQLAERRAYEKSLKEELRNTGMRLNEEAERRSAAERDAARLPALEARIEELEARIRGANEVASSLRSENARLTTALEQERAHEAEKLKLLQEARQGLSDAFKALAGETLAANNQSCLDLARAEFSKIQEGAKGELEKRQVAVEELIKPLRESLIGVDQKIQQMEKERVGAYEGLKEQCRSLSESQHQLRSETANL